MKFRRVPILILAGITFMTSNALSAEYVAGMSCEEVGGFASEVAEQKKLGDSLKEQIADMRQSLPPDQYADTKHQLEMIIRGIYSNKAFSDASPEEIGNAYKKSCEFVDH